MPRLGSRVRVSFPAPNFKDLGGLESSRTKKVLKRLTRKLHPLDNLAPVPEKGRALFCISNATKRLTAPHSAGQGRTQGVAGPILTGVGGAKFVVLKGVVTPVPIPLKNKTGYSPPRLETRGVLPPPIYFPSKPQQFASLRSFLKSTGERLLSARNRSFFQVVNWPNSPR